MIFNETAVFVDFVIALCTNDHVPHDERVNMIEHV
jgi:hypothetical protein